MARPDARQAPGGAGRPGPEPLRRSGHASPAPTMWVRRLPGGKRAPATSERRRGWRLFHGCVFEYWWSVRPVLLRLSVCDARALCPYK